MSQSFTPDEARRLALALPASAEQAHHGFPSFRVRGRIFATLPDPEHMNIMVDEYDVHAMVATNPTACEELWWGRQLRGVRINLAVAPTNLIAELLENAWRRKAPPQVQQAMEPRTR